MGKEGACLELQRGQEILVKQKKNKYEIKKLVGALKE